jgi:pimeloyl-ACP methyl ester carboxylesterase
MSGQTQRGVTAVLVHGAWFDGSSWNKVAAELRRKGFNVAAAQIPLTSLGDDVTAARRVLTRHEGPVVLVGHSYGGAAITAAGTENPNVKALVYVAAIVPDEGENVGQVFRRAPPHPDAPALEPDADGFLWVNADAFRNAIAPDATREDGFVGGSAEADLGQLSRRSHDQAGLAGDAVMVLDRGKRPHGFAGHATVPRGADEIEGGFLGLRSRAACIAVGRRGEGDRRRRGRLRLRLLSMHSRAERKPDALRRNTVAGIILAVRLYGAAQDGTVAESIQLVIPEVAILVISILGIWMETRRRALHPAES